MSKARWGLSGALAVLSIWAAVHSLGAYVAQGSTLGAAVVVGLLAILLLGLGSLGRARVRAERELVGLAATPRGGELFTGRRARLEKLVTSGVKPDVAALGRVAAADESQRAVLGRYLVATTVLFGLVGTFAGLMQTLRRVAPLVADAQANGAELVAAPLIGLDVTFGASLVAIMVTLALTLVAGDLAIAEERLLAALEEITAHELVPSLWSAQDSASERTAREVASLRSELASFAATVGGGVGASLEKALSGIGERVGASTRDALGGVATSITGALGTATRGLEEKVTRVTEALGTKVTAATELLGTSVTAAVSGSQTQVAEAVERLSVAAEGAAARMGNAAEGAAARMGSAVEGASARQTTAVEAELQRLAERLEAAASGMRGDVLAATGAATELLSDALARTAQTSSAEAQRVVTAIEVAMERTHQRVGDSALVVSEAAMGAARETQLELARVSTAAVTELGNAGAGAAHELRSAAAALEGASRATQAAIETASRSSHDDVERLVAAVESAIQRAVRESVADASEQAGARVHAVATALEDKLGPIVIEEARRLAVLSESAVAAATQVQETLAVGTQRALEALGAASEGMRTALVEAAGEARSAEARFLVHAEKQADALVARADHAVQRTEAALAELATVQATALRQATEDFVRSLVTAVEQQGTTVGTATRELGDVAGRLRELLDAVGPALIGLAPELGGVAKELAQLAARAEASDEPTVVLEELVRLGEGVERMEGLLRVVQGEPT